MYVCKDACLYNVLCAVCAGALLVFFLRPTAKRLALYYTIITITSTIFTFIFFLRCPTYDIAGITVPYPNK